MCEQLGVNPEIQVDGGITPENVHVLTEAGANVIVAGSSVFKAQGTKAAIDMLKG